MAASKFAEDHAHTINYVKDMFDAIRDTNPIGLSGQTVAMLTVAAILVQLTDAMSDTVEVIKQERQHNDGNETGM